MALPQTISFDNLLSAAKAYLTPDVVRNASAMTGEPEAATRQAMQGGLASVFAGLTNVASTSEGASTLGSLIREPFIGKFLDNVSSSFGGKSETSSVINSGEGLLGKIFGDRSSDVADAVARSSGIGSSSSGKLMAMLAPLAVGVLGKHAAARGLSGTGLANLLIEQRDEFAAVAPAGVSKLFVRAPAPVGIHVAPDTDVDTAPRPVGIHVAPDTELSRYDTPSPLATVRTPERPAGVRWWPLLLIGLALLGLLWLFRNIGGRAREAGRQAVTTTENAQPSPPPPVAANTSAPAASVPTGTVKSDLERFLADGGQTAPRTFVFDHLNFESASTQLTPDSQGTVTNLSQILKAHPNAQVRLSGYADNTGARAANQRLSLDRANAVKAMLVTSGIAPERIATNGYGQDRPIAPNDTEEGRARNRRTELTVTQK